MTAPTNTEFVSGTTITSQWLNGVNDHVNDKEPSAHTSDNIAYQPSGTGAVPTDVQSKLREFVSVKDFGAVGDGVTDDTAAIQGAIDYCAIAEKKLFFPSGKYLVGSTLYLPDSVSNPYKPVSFEGETVVTQADDVKVGAVIFSTAVSLFKTKTTPTPGGSLAKVYFTSSNLGYVTSYSTNPNAVCFDTMSLSSSDIGHNLFYGFNRVIVGALNGVTHFHHNVVASRVLLYPASSYTTASADSEISYNYINGLGGTPAGMTTTPVIELANTGQMTVSHNYIDFAYNAVSVGGTGQHAVVSHNTIDLCFIGVLMKYGPQPVVIENNSFFNINKTKVSSFPSPITGMSTDNWTCIKASDEYVANRQILNNRYGTADTFLRLGTSGHWNIIERCNVGQYPNSASGLPVAAVDFGSRNTDTATYPLDGQYNYFDSIENKVQSNILAKRNAYFGLQYLIGSPPIKVRVNDDWSLSDMNGSYLWGKSNLLAATDFATGWTFGTNISQVGGVYTAASGSGWSYISASLSAGTYVICANITSLSGTGTYVTFGYSLSGTPGTYVQYESSNLPAASGGSITTAGRAFAKITVPSTTARIAIYVPAGTNCTIDYIHVIKIA